MLNAAQLALFDQGDAGVEFLPRDTGSTAAGAAEATRAAQAQGARAFAGPLTLGETAAAAGVARASGAPVLAFTSDASQAGNGVWVFGVTPAEQADRMAAAAAAAGRQPAWPAGAGRCLRPAARRRDARPGQRAGAAAPLVLLHPRISDPAQVARDLASQAGPEGLDAVLLAQGGDRARQAAAALAAALPAPAALPRHRALGAGHDAGAGARPGRRLVPRAGPAGPRRLRQPLPGGLRRQAAAAGRRRLRRRGAGGAGGAGAGRQPAARPAHAGRRRADPAGGRRPGAARPGVFEVAPAGEALLVEPAPVPGGPG